jgi:hypothetical protein
VEPFRWKSGDNRKKEKSGCRKWILMSETGWPDWAILSPSGDSLLWAIVCFGPHFEKFKSSSKFLGNFFHDNSYVLILTKKWVWLHFGRFFHTLIRSLWSENTATSAKPHSFFLS